MTTNKFDNLIKYLIRFFNKEWSGAFLAIIILSISIEIVTSGKPFFHPSNIMTILNNSAAIGVIAGGMTLVILTAGIDLSVGSVMGMVAALTGYLVSFWGFPPGMSILAGLAIGSLVGILHGGLIAYLGMPAFIVTLAGLSVWRGTAHLTTGAKATPELPDLFDYFGRFNPLAWLRTGYKDSTLPTILEPVGKFVDAYWMSTFRTFQMSLLIFILFFIVLALIINKTRLGRYTYSIGSNEQGSRQAGINTRFYKLLPYFICSASAALGAFLFLGRAPYAKSDYGQMWELDAIAAVVIGGTSLFGGRGTLLGTFFGVILLKLINNGLTLAQLNTFWQMVVTGIVILIAIGIDIVRQNQSAELTRRMIVFIGSAMSFFVFMTPASLYLRAWVAVHEHNSVTYLKESGQKLVTAHNYRLLPQKEVNEHIFMMQTHITPTIIFGLLFLSSLFLIKFKFNWLAYIFSFVYILMIFLLFYYEFHVATPFLVLGSILMFISSFIPYIYKRAQEIK